MDALLKTSAGPITFVIRQAKLFAADKTFAFIASYALLSLLLVPLASGILALYSQLMRGHTSGIMDTPEFEDLVQGAVSAALAFPLWLTNKRITTRRRPVLNPRLFPLLIVLGLLLALEYLWFFSYFTNGIPLRPADFLTQVAAAAQSRWLYPLPFGVITINLLAFAAFTYVSDDLAEMSRDREFVGQFGFIAVALVAIVISVLLRLLFWILGGLF